MSIDFKRLIEHMDKDPEPLPDLADCEECGWHGKVIDCVKEEEGTYEEGFYIADICPECGSGVMYDMSIEQVEKWNEWYERKEVKKNALRKSKKDQTDYGV